MQAAPHAKQKQARILTGRAVLLWLVAFFGVVFAVNGVLVQAAISTFGGVETTSSSFYMISVDIYVFFFK